MKYLLPSFVIALALVLDVDQVEGQAIEKGMEQKAFITDLKPGDYVWQPEISPSGPVSIVISLSDQLLYVYRNGVRIGRSTISSGKDGHKTPPGFFTILEKNVVHHSTVYHGASMPFMERITWGGVAIHAGNLPGYPESHGCVHVPMDFARKLYEVTETGTTVLVTDGINPINSDSKPGLLLSSQMVAQANPSAAPDPAFDFTTSFTWKPETSLTGPISVVFSTLDKKICVYRNGIQIGQVKVGLEESGHSLGNHVYIALAETTPDGYHKWNVLGNLDSSPAPDIQTLRQQMTVPPAFSADLRDVVTPGTTLLITDRPLNNSLSTAPSTSILDSTGTDTQ